MGVTWKPAAPLWALALLAVLLTTVALGDLPWWALAGALLTPVLAVVLLAHQPVVSLALCVLTAVATATALADAVPPWTAALGAAVSVISYLAGRRAPRSTGALAVFAVGLLLAGLLVLVREGVWAIGLLLVAMTVVLPWLVGRSVGQQAELAAAATERVHLRERARLAHDVHDTLGHELSLLALRAGALELSLGEPHREAAAELRAGAAAAIERLADVVTVLRDGEPAPLHPDDVEDLVARAAKAGMTVDLEWHGPRVRHHTAHRVVQEALTNAAKHASGANVRVRVDVADAIEISVTSPLPKKPHRAAGGQVGLVALRERVRLAGGTLLINRGDRTFEVVATLPHTGKQ